MTKKQGVLVRPVWFATSILTTQACWAASMGELVILSGENEPFNASVSVILPRESASVLARVSQSEPMVQDLSVFVEQHPNGVYLIYMMASESLPMLKNLTLELEYNGEMLSRTYYLSTQGSRRPNVGVEKQSLKTVLPTRLSETNSNWSAPMISKHSIEKKRSEARENHLKHRVNTISKNEAYQIQQGDTLSEIALRFYPKEKPARAMQWIAQHNPTLITPKQLDKIYAGSILNLPKIEPIIANRNNSATTLPTTEQSLRKINLSESRSKSASPLLISQSESKQAQTLSAKISEKQQQLENVHERIRLLEQEITRLSAQKKAERHGQQVQVTLANQPIQNQSVAEHALDGRLEFKRLEQLVSDWLLTGIGGLATMTLLAGLWVNQKRQVALAKSALGALNQDASLIRDFHTLSMPMHSPIEVSFNDVLLEIDQKWQAKKWSQVESMLIALRNTYPESPDLLIKLIELYALMHKKEAMLKAKHDFVSQWGVDHPLYVRVFGSQASQDDATPSFVKNLQKETVVEFKTHPASNISARNDTIMHA